MSIVKSALLALFSAGCVATSVEEADSGVRQIENATVLSSTARPPMSGVFRTWVILAVAAPGQDAIEMYVPFMTADQEMPEVGATCSIVFHEAFLEGFSARGDVDRGRPLRVIDVMDCDGTIYRF
jgi:hypothetical protein